MGYNLTPFPEHLHPLITHAVDRKESAVRDVNAHDDIVPAVEAFRKDHMVAAVICSQVDRDQALDAAAIAVPGYNADACVLTLDAHFTQNATVNEQGQSVWSAGPRKGQVVKQHEMQTMCDEEGACEVGLITDTLIVLRVTRDGLIEQAMLPYHVHKSAREVAWQDKGDQPLYVSNANEGEGAAGFVPETVMECFAAPPLLERYEGVEIPLDKVEELKAQMRELGIPTELLNDSDGSVRPPRVEDYGLSPEVAQYHADCAVTKVLGQRGYGVMLIPENDKHAEIVEQSLRTSRVH